MAKRKRFSDKLRQKRKGDESTPAPNNRKPQRPEVKKADDVYSAAEEAGDIYSGAEGSAAANKTRRRRPRTESAASKARKSKLNIEADSAIDAGDAMTRTGKKMARDSGLRKSGYAGSTVTAVTHGAIDNANEDDNAGTNAAQLGGKSAEDAVRLGRKERYSSKLRSRKRQDSRSRAGKEQEDSFEGYSSKRSDGGYSAKKSSGDSDAPSYGVASGGTVSRGTGSGGSSKRTFGNGSNPYSRWKQRQTLKKEYVTRRSASPAGSMRGTAEGTKKTAGTAKEAAEKTADFVKSHSHLFLVILAAALVFIIIASLFSSCAMLTISAGNTVTTSVFTAEDEDILAVEADYTALEEALQDEIDSIESTYSGYDEYNYDLVEIGHNPYELAALLTVEFEDYNEEEVQARLQEIFEAQYELTIEAEVEVRTRTETRTGVRTLTDAETGKTYSETYTYEVEVEYNYCILNVTLTNTGITAVAYSSGLTDDQLARYEILLETLGGREDLFSDVSFAVSTGEYTDYDIPGEALTDEKFANMIAEAEKYLGMAYVWGGSSPSTGFDCSGFVSWVINNCGNGWSVGRLTANGLMGICDIISSDEAEPGDLIFFQGTYNTTGASHVGIYVGNGMMIHCGNPISYTSIETSYWQEHFYCFGRIKD